MTFLLCKNLPPANVHGRTFAGKVSTHVFFLKGLRKKRFRTDRDVHSLACFRFIFARAVYLYRLFQKADEEFILRYVAVKKRTSVYAFYRPVANFCSEKFL